MTTFGRWGSRLRCASCSAGTGLSNGTRRLLRTASGTITGTGRAGVLDMFITPTGQSERPAQVRDAAACLLIKPADSRGADPGARGDHSNCSLESARTRCSKTSQPTTNARMQLFAVCARASIRPEEWPSMHFESSYKQNTRGNGWAEDGDSPDPWKPGTAQQGRP